MIKVQLYYFNIEYNSKELFKGLKISKLGDNYLKEMNKYPVISLSLKECKKGTYKKFIISFKNIIANLYDKYTYLLESDLIKEVDKKYFERCLNYEEEELLYLAIDKLIRMLESYYNEQVIVLLDEYDVSILEGYLKGYYSEIIEFMRDVFSSVFKDNLSLKKGIITGILKVNKEGMFSGANNIKDYNITEYRYSEQFGFTEDEVKEVLKEYGISDKFDLVKRWL